MKRGTKVIIKHNPFDGEEGQNIIGTVTKWRPNEGFMQCHLAELKYKDPITGKQKTLPFGDHHFEVTTAKNLNQLADDYETNAAHFRKMAQEILASQK